MWMGKAILDSPRANNSWQPDLLQWQSNLLSWCSSGDWHCLLDLPKAFYIISHSLLLKKLMHYGLDKRPLLYPLAYWNSELISMFWYNLTKSITTSENIRKISSAFTPKIKHLLNLKIRLKKMNQTGKQKPPNPRSVLFIKR